MHRRLGIVGLIVAVAIAAGAVLAWAQTTPANVPLARVAPLTTALKGVTRVMTRHQNTQPDPLSFVEIREAQNS
jgi:serine protease inhibitor ecotin